MNIEAPASPLSKMRCPRLELAFDQPFAERGPVGLCQAAEERDPRKLLGPVYPCSMTDGWRRETRHGVLP